MAIPAVITAMARKMASGFGRDALKQIAMNGGSSAGGRSRKPTIKLDESSYKMTLQVLTRNFKEIKDGARKGVKASAVVLFEAVLDNMSSTAHTKQDLARLDHPYADRHGRIRTTSLGGMKPYEIHDQDGTMRRSLRVRNQGNKHSSSSTVEFDGSAPHTKWVVEGTRTMLARDVIRGTAGEARVQDKMGKAMLKHVNKKVGVEVKGAVWQFV